MRKDGFTFVWYDEEKTGRNLYGDFHRSFCLDKVPENVEYKVFADSHYRLEVNGVFVGFGPVRFNPLYPAYDTYNLAEYLKPGENVIAVTVNYFGMKTYKAIPNRPGFACKGEIITDEKTVSLDATEFSAVESSVYNIYTPKMSFALNPTEVYDQRQEQRGWKNAESSCKDWPKAKIIKAQNAWGELKPRTIPFMSLSPVAPDSDIDIYPLENTEDIHSFEMPIPDFYSDDNEYSNFIAMKTWIWSPKKQKVVMGTFWCESWLNGKEIKPGRESEKHSIRIEQVWEFEEGWNFYMAKVGAYGDCLHQMYGVPKSAGLIFAADKKFDSEYSFAHTPLLTKEKYEKTLAVKELPYSCNDELPELDGWVYVHKTDGVNNPVRIAAWDRYREQFESVNISGLAGKTFSKDLYPEGFTLVVDIGHTALLFPKFKITGVKDAIVDIHTSERLKKDNIHLKCEFNYMSGSRVICGDDTVEYMPLHPLGFRYMALTVRNPVGDVTIDDLSFIDASYPVENIGEFECSDPLLNDIWEACRLTQSINMEDAYVDCVGRERGMYIRDTIIQYYNNTVAFNDHVMFENCMGLYAMSADQTNKYRAVYPNDGTYTISDFSLNAIEGHWIYYKNTGDKSHVKKYWDKMLKNMDWFNDLADEREDMLLDAEWDIHRGIKANYGGFHGDLGVVKGSIDNTGIHCLFSSTYLYAINCIIDLAAVTGDKKVKEEYIRRRDILKRSISEKFYDKKAGLFKDNLEGEIHSYHANLYAIRCGAADREQTEKIKSYLRENLNGVLVDGYSLKKGYRFSPSYCFYILDGLYMADLPDVAERLIKSGWGYYLSKGLPTVPEYFGNKNGDSLCHAWSASPMYFLSKNLSGVEFIDAPVNKKIIINVKADSPTSAKVTYPHPNGGVIRVEWHMENGIRVFDRIEVPKGTEFEIRQ